MILYLGKCLCVSFQNLAGIEINLEGGKGNFKFKNRLYSWLFGLGFLARTPASLNTLYYGCETNMPL